MRKYITVLLAISLLTPWTTQGAFLGFTRTSDLQAFQEQIDAIQRQINDIRDQLNSPRGFVLGYPGNGLLGAATGSGNFPTSTLNNFQDGDTINAGDWNAVERKIGIDHSSDNGSLDWLLRAGSSTDPGHKHTTSSITGYGTFTNATATNLYDSAGNKYSTSTYLGIGWTVVNETSNSKDVPIFTFRTTSTIRDVWAGNNTSGTVTFNIGITSNTSNATSTWRKLFTSDQTVKSTTSTQLTVNGSSTVSAGDMLGYFTGVASSTEFGFTVYYTTP